MSTDRRFEKSSIVLAWYSALLFRGSCTVPLAGSNLLRICSTAIGLVRWLTYGVPTFTALLHKISGHRFLGETFRRT